MMINHFRIELESSLVSEKSREAQGKNFFQPNSMVLWSDRKSGRLPTGGKSLAAFFHTSLVFMDFHPQKKVSIAINWYHRYVAQIPQSLRIHQRPLAVYGLLTKRLRPWSTFQGQDPAARLIQHTQWTASNSRKATAPAMNSSWISTL